MATWITSSGNPGFFSLGFVSKLEPLGKSQVFLFPALKEAISKKIFGGSRILRHSQNLHQVSQDVSVPWLKVHHEFRLKWKDIFCKFRKSQTWLDICIWDHWWRVLIPVFSWSHVLFSDSKNDWFEKFQGTPPPSISRYQKNGWNLSGFSWSHLLHHPKE